MIEAAAEAGVKWVLPVEFGGDNANKRLEEAVPIYAVKRAPRKKIEELSGKYEGFKWIGIVTNPWFDFVSFCFGIWREWDMADNTQSMKMSGFQVDVKNKTVLLLDG